MAEMKAVKKSVKKKLTRVETMEAQKKMTEAQLLKEVKDVPRNGKINKVRPFYLKEILVNKVDELVEKDKLSAEQACISADISFPQYTTWKGEMKNKAHYEVYGVLPSAAKKKSDQELFDEKVKQLEALQDEVKALAEKLKGEVEEKSQAEKDREANIAKYA